MSDANLKGAIARAVEAGLELLPCHLCDGSRKIYARERAAYEREPRVCPACEGTGQDRTPGGVLMAVVSAWARHPNAFDCCVRPDTLWLRRLDPTSHTDREWSHNGTPDRMATAACRAYCSATEKRT